MKKLLLVIIGMLVFVNVEAANITDHSSAIRGANSYMEKLHNYNLYLINESNVKYGYSANSITINSNYINGGLINVDEFNVSNSKGNSYLYNGTKYWTMTESGSNAGIVSSYITEQVSKTENYGSRVTEYVRPRIWATGSGTYNDPWVFDEDINPEELTITANYGLHGTSNNTVEKKPVTINRTISNYNLMLTP